MVLQSEPNSALVFEIQRLSTEDGPGIRTTVFFKGCPLRCVWCHNPESWDMAKSIQWYHVKCIGCGRCIENCPNHAIHRKASGIQIDRSLCHACGTCAANCPATAMKAFGEYMTLPQLLEEIRKDLVYYQQSGGGITISGGEPTMQPQVLKELLFLCKQNGISTALDTCGHTNRAVLEDILPFIDLILYDLKEIDPNRHKEYTGVSNDLVLANCEWLAEQTTHGGPRLWIRTPLIPDYTARVENIQGIAHFIRDRLNKHVDRWDLLAFNNLARDKYARLDLTWPLISTPLMTQEELQSFLQIAQSAEIHPITCSGLNRVAIFPEENKSSPFFPCT